MKKRYPITVTRDGNWWFIEVPGVQGGYTQARRLDQVEAATRDLLATLLDSPPDSFEIQVTVEWPAKLRAAGEKAIKARKGADLAQNRASTEMRRAATAAAEAGFTVRDVAVLLGVSPQRISQLGTTLAVREVAAAYESAADPRPATRPRRISASR